MINLPLGEKNDAFYEPASYKNKLHLSSLWIDYWKFSVNEPLLMLIYSLEGNHCRNQLHPINELKYFFAVEVWPSSLHRLSLLWKISFMGPGSTSEIFACSGFWLHWMSLPECSISRNVPSGSYIVRYLRPCHHLLLEKPLAKRREVRWDFWKGSEKMVTPLRLYTVADDRHT